jgi:predicted ester cyclase
MASKIDVYNKFYDESWSNPPLSLVETNKKYLSSDFQSLDKDGNVEMDKAAYIGMSQLLFGSFSDFKFVKNDVRADGDIVFVTGHFEGKHVGDLDFSAMGLGVIPASGKMVIWPETTVMFKFAGDKIVSIQPEGDTGGTAAFLKALGVEMPS